MSTRGVVWLPCHTWGLEDAPTQPSGLVSLLLRCDVCCTQAPQSCPLFGFPAFLPLLPPSLPPPQLDAVLCAPSAQTQEAPVTCQWRGRPGLCAVNPAVKHGTLVWKHPLHCSRFRLERMTLGHFRIVRLLLSEGRAHVGERCPLEGSALTSNDGQQPFPLHFCTSTPHVRTSAGACEMNA